MGTLKKLHLMKGLAWNGGMKLELVLQAVDKRAPPSSRLDKRPPVSLEMLELLAEHLDLTDNLDACVFMVACCAFYGQLRLGEILHTNQDVSTYKPKFNPLFSDLKPPSTKRGSRILHVPYSKTLREKGDDVIMARQAGPTDPITAVDNHASVNSLSPHDPFASYWDPSKNKRLTLTKDKFLGRCNDIWKRNDIKRFTGHSFRIGGTTYFLISGVNPDAVKCFGRWLSNSFLDYWRQLDDLAVQHIEMIAAEKGYVLPA